MPFGKLIGAAMVAAVTTFAATAPGNAAVAPEAGALTAAPPVKTTQASTPETGVELAGGRHWHYGPPRGRAYRKGYRQGYRAGRHGYRPGKAYRRGYRQGYRDSYRPRYRHGHYGGYYGPRGVFYFDGPRVDFGVRF